MSKVFAYGPGSIPGRVIPKIQKWYFIRPWLAFGTLRWGSRVKWSNPGNGVAPSPTLRCCFYTYICGNIINNNDEKTHFFRKIYLSHLMGCERVVCERLVVDWTDWNILTPSSSDYSSTSFSFYWADQPGVLMAQALCWGLVLTASNCNSNSN